jgi:hypothetical protein
VRGRVGKMLAESSVSWNGEVGEMRVSAPQNAKLPKRRVQLGWPPLRQGPHGPDLGCEAAGSLPLASSALSPALQECDVSSHSVRCLLAKPPSPSEFLHAASVLLCGHT